MNVSSRKDRDLLNKRLWTDAWILDEKSNAIDHLEKAVRFLLEADKDKWALKWIAIAIHGALYGFGVCAVCAVSTTTNNYNVVKIIKKGKHHLKSFDEIMKMCQSEKSMQQYAFSKHLRLTSEQQTAIEWIKNNIRNQVEHFDPRIYVVTVTEIPQAIARCFEVIEFLTIESGNIWLEEDEHAWVKSLCDSGKSLALNLKINPDRSAKHTKKPYQQLERIMPGVIQQEKPESKSGTQTVPK